MFYNEDELKIVFRIGGLCYVKGYLIGFVGRYDIRGVVKRYVLCYLKGSRKFKFLIRLKILLVIIDIERIILVIIKVKVI